MKHSAWFGLGLGIFVAGPATAAPSLRAQVKLQGDFALIGNTLAQDCRSTAPAPVVGTVGMCPPGSDGVAGDAPDVFWQADFPAAGMATASTAVSAAAARSTAVLVLPAGATVTQAYLYWGGRPDLGNLADGGAVVDRPGASGFTANVTAMQSWLTAGPALPAPAGADYPGYQSVADVTALVQQNGAGAYRVGAVDSIDVGQWVAGDAAVGWWMVVLYQVAGAPNRQISLFDGLDLVDAATPLAATVNGFVIPPLGGAGRLGVIAYGGDVAATGDALSWNGVALADALNPADDFFNGTRSMLGAPGSVAGDLPELTGAPGSMSELDLDVVDVTAQLSPGQTSASIGVVAGGDTLFVGGLVTSIPSLGCLADADCGSTTSGQVCDATTHQCAEGCRGSGGNGCPSGQLCTSSDASIGTCLGCFADAQCGTTTSGKVCDASAKQCIDGCRGSGGNGCTPGLVCTSMDGSIGACLGCAGDADCGATTSGKVCDASTQHCIDGCRGTGGNGCPSGVVCSSSDGTIGVCAGCISDADCGGPTSGKVCDDVTEACIDGCRGAGGNGCPSGEVCTSSTTTVGQCLGCISDNDCGGPASGKVCDDTTEVCVDGCRGMGGNGCPSEAVCTSQDTLVGACVACVKDADCGGPTSGRVCDVKAHTCGEGCRESGGNGCPEGQTCSAGGVCIDGGAGGAGTGGGGAGGGDDGVVASGGGLCAARPARGDAESALWVGLAGVLLAARRRRRR